LDPRLHRALAHPSRVRILRALREAGEPRSAGELAREVDLHATTVRGHLDILSEADLVRAHHEDRQARGRPRLLYVATDGEQAGGAEGYRVLAEILAGHLAATATDPVAEATRAGQAWGTYLAQPPPYCRLSIEESERQVLDVFSDLGFAPEWSEDRAEMWCHDCPFREVAEQHPDVACSIHLGLLQGALEATHSPLRATTLEPFVEPSLCIARFAPTTEAAQG